MLWVEATRKTHPMVQTLTWMTYRVPNTLPSDTEESVLGTELHQEAIGALADMLHDVNVRRGAGWGICETIALLGLRHEDGTDYDPRPDVMVLQHPLPRLELSSIRIEDAGTPLFIAEIASETTRANDIGDKRHAYAAIGVPEYVVFDPGGYLLATPLVAWRLGERGYEPWAAEANGWWQSAVLDLSFQPGYPFLQVRDHDGVEIEPSGVVRQRARDLEHRLLELEQRLAEEARLRADLETRLRQEERERRDR
jgi:Uma2 family endonuclease